MNLSRREQLAIQALQLTDAAVVFVSLWIGVLLRNAIYATIPADTFLGRLLDLPKPPLEGVGQVAAVLYLVVPFTPLVLEGFGFYAERYRKSFNRSLVEVLKSLAVITLLVSVVSVILRFPVSSRPVLFFGVTVSGVLLLVRERMSMAIRRNFSDHEQRRLPLILAGTSATTVDYWQSVDEETRFRWRVAEEFDLATCGPDELEKMLEKHAAHRVVFLPEGVPFDRLARAVERCELQGVEAWIAASFIQARIAQPTFDFMGDRAMLVLRSTPGLSWAVQIKDLFDRIAALFLIIVSFPLWMVAMMGIKLCSRGPVFFIQERGGRYGKPYRMWKFRTMCPDAEAKLAEVKETAGNQMNGPVFKHDRDPRVFRFGIWLRKMSIDELPQLINVLFGDMSMVGPRPLPMYEVEAIEKSEHRRRMSVKPGITCTWQAGGRNQITDFEDWVKLDLEYIDNWSLWLDFKILLMTVPAVLFTRGAK